MSLNHPRLPGSFLLTAAVWTADMKQMCCALSCPDMELLKESLRAQWFCLNVSYLLVHLGHDCENWISNSNNLIKEMSGPWHKADVCCKKTVWWNIYLLCWKQGSTIDSCTCTYELCALKLKKCIQWITLPTRVPYMTHMHISIYTCWQTVIQQSIAMVWTSKGLV